MSAARVPTQEQVIPIRDRSAPRDMIEASERLRKEGYTITPSELRMLAQAEGLVGAGVPFPLHENDHWAKLEAAVKRTLPQHAATGDRRAPRAR